MVLEMPMYQNFSHDHMPNWTLAKSLIVYSFMNMTILNFVKYMSGHYNYTYETLYGGGGENENREIGL
jgi:hypothetical protein